MDHLPRIVLAQACSGLRLPLPQEEVQHLGKVLRLTSGAPLEVLDGTGRAYAATLEWERRGGCVIVGATIRTEPAPGTIGALLPRVEIWAPWPKGTRAADAVGRLAQLGVAAWQPIVTAHTEAEARHDGEGRREKLARVAREALKQCAGLHALAVHPAIDLEDALRRAGQVPADKRTMEHEVMRQQGAAELPLGSHSQVSPQVSQGLEVRPSALPNAPTHEREPREPTESICDFVMDPSASAWLSSHLDETLPAAQGCPTTLRLWAGPEAGFSTAEMQALQAQGWRCVRVSARILRIETAVEAAAAIVLERWGARRRLLR